MGATFSAMVANQELVANSSSMLAELSGEIGEAIQNASFAMEKESMALFADDVCELGASVVELSRCYIMVWAFWRTYKNENFQYAIKFHKDFMDTTRDSLLQSFFIAAYRLFDRNPKAKSLRKLLNSVASFDPPLARELTARIDSQQLLLSKMSNIRHKIYAHRDVA
jgi:AbiU2